MIAGKFIKLVKKIFTRSEKKGVSLQFKNTSTADILFLRVIISGKTYEFKDLLAGASTIPVLLNESPVYFFSYIVTATAKYYFEPNSQQLNKTIVKGEVIIVIFIEKQNEGKGRIIMHPEVM